MNVSEAYVGEKPTPLKRAPPFSFSISICQCSIISKKNQIIFADMNMSLSLQPNPSFLSKKKKKNQRRKLTRKTFKKIQMLLKKKPFFFWEVSMNIHAKREVENASISRDAVH